MGDTMSVNSKSIQRTDVGASSSADLLRSRGYGDQRERLFLNALPIGVLLTDINGLCIDINRAALAMLELPYESVVGRHINEFLAEFADIIGQNRPEDANVIDVGEVHIHPPTALECVVELSAAKLDSSDIPTIVYFFREISDELALAQQLRETAQTDALTSLPNRHAVEQQIDLALRNISRGAPPSVLCFLDLDNFKAVNDTCGHAAGDAMLQAVAQVFRQRARATDTIGRVGGDEFALLLNGCQLADAVNYVSSLRDRVIGLGFNWDDQCFQVGLSAGITLLTPQTTSVAEALAEADIACFAAKSAGRSKTRVYDERLRRHGEALSADAEIANRLREALDSDAIALNAQPLQPMRAGRGSEGTSEVLIRLSDRQGKLIPPSVLLPIAARFGLAQALDQWVIRRTLSWLASRVNEPWPTRLYVNIMASSLVDESFTHFLQTVLPKSLAPRFGIEIAEANIMLHPEAARRTIRQINAMGCGVSIDRVSGRADAIALLSGLPLSLLKLSPDFSTMTADSDMTYIQAKALVRIAHKLSLPLAVTSVETRDTLACVRRLGAEFGQGVAIAPAAPLILPSEQNRTHAADNADDEQRLA